MRKKVEFMKKIISVLAAVMLIAAASTTVFAHGHGHRYSQTSVTKYSICDIQDCTLADIHTHNGQSYASHYYGDGHVHHKAGGFHH